jgi:hypothetical protein
MVNENLNSDILKIDALEKEYNTVLKQYEEAYKNCNTELQNSLNAKQNSFKTFTNRAYWGTAGLKEGTVGSQTDCENMCASDVTCSGATFNPVQKYCWTRSGKGTLSPTSNTTVALLPTVKGCVLTLKSLNDRLIEINKQLTEVISTTNSQLVIAEASNNNSKAKLYNYYRQLLKERLQMGKILSDYKTIDNENENQSLYVLSQDNTLRAWILTACILILIVVNKMLGNETSVVKLFWATMMTLLLIASFSISNASGFIVWCALILIIVLMKMDIIPNPKE